jgi:cytochrome c oxidase subunit 3
LATGRTGIATVILLASSWTMHLAVKAAEREDRRTAIRMLLVTAGLAVVFLGNLAWEYAEAPFSISSHAYGSMFFMMTGFHGLHVIGGILLMFGVIGMIGGRGSRAAAGPPAEVCGYYWHFVDVVWVAMFTTIYVLR